MNPVPERYLGVWQRTLLQTTDGVEDRSTRVFWLQTRFLHADLRIPLPTPEDPVGRAAQAGFAGITEVQGERCQWHRLIDFQPHPSIDIGRMDFFSNEEVHERALDDSYLEIWQRLPDSLGVSQAIWLESGLPDGRQACLLRAGDYFLFAAERPQACRSGVALEQQLEGLSAAEAERLLGFELSFGRVQGAAQPWLIELSSLPGRTGQVLLDAAPDLPLEDWPNALLTGLGVYPPASGWLRAALPTLTRLCEEVCT